MPTIPAGIAFLPHKGAKITLKKVRTLVLPDTNVEL